MKRTGLPLAVVLALLLAAAPAGARERIGGVVSAHAGLPMEDVTITFLIPGGQPDVVTATRVDGRWHVAPSQGREDDCRFVIDAKRLIAGRPLTQGVPRRCMSRWARKLRPDPWPGADS